MTSSDALGTEFRSEEQLEWQGELDSAMADLDNRIFHPRRRASDTAPQPTLPELGQVDITSELLDEISWRVAEQLRRSPAAGRAPTAPPAAMLPPVTAAPVATPLPDGAALVIRLRWPLFTWPFKRRRSRRRSGLALSNYTAT